jgi:hypothetical protein
MLLAVCYLSAANGKKKALPLGFAYLMKRASE